MGVVFDEIVTEVDTQEQVATATEHNENSTENEESCESKFLKAMKHINQRNLRLSAE